MTSQVQASPGKVRAKVQAKTCPDQPSPGKSGQFLYLLREKREEITHIYITGSFSLDLPGLRWSKRYSVSLCLDLPGHMRQLARTCLTFARTAPDYLPSPPHSTTGDTTLWKGARLHTAALPVCHADEGENA